MNTVVREAGGSRLAARGSLTPKAKTPKPRASSLKPPARRAPRVLFRVAAGPAQGFGHLVRCRALAQALGVTPFVALRGSPRTAAVAQRLGCRLWRGSTRQLTRAQFDLLVIDDPSPRAAQPWVDSARRAGLVATSLHDAGIGVLATDLSIDGSLVGGGAGPRADLCGPAYAILDPSIAQRRHRRLSRHDGRVLVTLGGGRHVRQRGAAIASAILSMAPGTRVDIARGFAPGPALPAPIGARWIAPRRGLTAWLETTTVAVVAGGITLYEACALGTPTVVVPVVDAQRAAAAASARTGAAQYAAADDPDAAVAEAAAMAVSLLRTPALREALGRRARAIVDGRGAARVAARLHALLTARSLREARHAA